MTQQLTTHFTLEELTATSTGIENKPPAGLLQQILALATNLEIVRAILGRVPLVVNSAYRGPQVNQAVGGVPTSEHLLGRAADIICPTFGSPEQIAVSLRSYSNVLNYNQLILENTWVHISFPPDGTRGKLECLTIFMTGDHKVVTHIGLQNRNGVIL